jgi:hypothetical protein
MAKKKHAVRKKYVNVLEQQKQQKAQYKKFFFEKLRNLCKQIGDVSLYNLISPIERETLYLLRGAPFKIIVEKGAKIPRRLMDALAKIIKSQLLAMKLEVVKGSGQIMTFADYSLVGRALESYVATQTEENYSGKEWFSKYIALRDEHRNAYAEGIEAVCAITCRFFEDMGEKILYTYNFEIYSLANDSNHAPQKNSPSFEKELNAYMGKDFRSHQKIIIGTYPLEVRKVTVGGETHSAIQMGAVHYEDKGSIFYPYALSLEDLPINTPFVKLKLPIYIQQHAIDRMKERIGGLVPPAFYKFILTDALVRKKFILTAKNRLLIACFTNELKIGYFVAEMVDGIILIRTFLLLTNSGTPEGNKLAQLTGLETEDRKYLSIDTLQGLANSDIEQNEAFCNLLRSAGCGSILELCKKVNNEPEMMWLLDKSQPKNIISDLITEYLKPNTDEEEYMSEV